MESSDEFSHYIDKAFLYFIKAEMAMTEEEKDMSQERSERYEDEYKLYLKDQQRKYGGGYVGGSFDPINTFDEFVFRG